MQGFAVSIGKSVVSNGTSVDSSRKSAINILDPSTKLDGPHQGGLRSRPAISDDPIGKGRHPKEGRDLQAVADVEIVNNCGFDAYIGIVYSTVQSDRWYRWPIVKDGGSVTITDVDSPTIFIYGLTTDIYDIVWDSDLSPHCFSPGDCLSARNVGSLRNGAVTYYICGGGGGLIDLTPESDAPTNSPTKKPVSTVALVTSSIDTQWVQGHNKRRTQFYAQFGLGPKDIKFSASLKTSARRYAKKLLQIGGTSSCEIEHGYLGDSYGGENIAAVWGSGDFANPLTPENVLSAWFEDEINLPFSQKGHATQVVFRSTHYVGCAGASKTLDGGGKCYIQVCRYISPGNCNMDLDHWLERTLDDVALCDPQCPPEGCF